MKLLLLLAAIWCSTTIFAELDALPRGLEEQNKIGFVGDLEQIKQRGFIRMLTRNTPGCYFIHRGALVGFEYELVQHFAKEHNLDVVVVVPPLWSEMADWLKTGRADFAAANITLTADRQNIQGLEFCQPYGEIFEMVVSRAKDDSIKSVKDLNGRTFHIRKSSAYFESLTQLKKETGAKYKIIAAPEDEETLQIIDKVSDGTYDLTLADQIILNQSASMGSEAKGALLLRRPRSYSWVVRPDQPQLQKAINLFFTENHKGTVFNTLFNRYFKEGLADKHSDSITLNDSGHISPYDKLIKQSARTYQMPWRLICAQMYQESRFDPKAKSWSGGQGLMQLMPGTAKELGVHNPNDPAENIDGAVKYLKQQYDRIKGVTNTTDRICFSLASYNGGYGHLLDARKLAKQQGYNPDIWFKNVESAYTLLSETKYAEKAKHGYCHSKEVISYVSQIMKRYIAYESQQPPE